jgi:hypothetical protein
MPKKTEKKEKKEGRRSNEVQLLELLKRVLPKATHDPKLAGVIYSAVEKELQSRNRAVSFDKFCEKVELPDLEPATISSVQKQFAATFSEGDVVIQPNKKEKSLSVEVSMPDGNQFTSEIKVRPLAPEGEEDPEFKPKFIPFPVALPGDQELIWALARAESMTPEEGARALAKVEDDFWASKTGQKLIRDRVERSFPEFISRAPSGMLSELGLKRHYKTPEPVKVLKPLPKR